MFLAHLRQEQIEDVRSELAIWAAKFAHGLLFGTSREKSRIERITAFQLVHVSQVQQEHVPTLELGLAGLDHTLEAAVVGRTTGTAYKCNGGHTW